MRKVSLRFVDSNFLSIAKKCEQISHLLGPASQIAKIDRRRYEKPPNSWMVYVEFLDRGDSPDLTFRLVEKLGGRNWIKEKFSDETEAIWSKGDDDGEFLVLGKSVSWMQLQAVDVTN